MNIELGPTLEELGGKLKPLVASLGKQRFWLGLAAVTTVVLLALAVIGRSAYARAAALDEEVTRVERIQSELDRWAGTITWPTPEETERWRESELVFQRLQASELQPLTLATQLSRRGEEIVAGDVRIRLVSTDSAYIPPPRSFGDWTITSGQTALAVELVGDWSSMISFLGALPPQVEMAGMEISTSDGSLSMDLLLLSREISPAEP